ncbi:MAG: hypothetical protein QNK37_38565 [Acidobacteriota bacterium]|nr:hypothetical protein [Acidobacteriota bacterium]
MILCILLLLQSTPNTALPGLREIFLDNDRAGLADLLDRRLRVHTDMNPLLYDRGNLDRQKVLFAFDKLQQRFQIQSIEVSNSQSDTNYAWLEIYLESVLIDRRDGRQYDATFAFHFKIIDGRMVISRWVLQDLQ